MVITLAMAVVALAIGFAIHASARMGPGGHARDVIAWLVLSLAPVLVVFGLFPDSSASGRLLGIQAGGAIAAYLAIWWAGQRSSRAGRQLDAREAALDRREEQVERRELAASATAREVVQPPQRHTYRLRTLGPRRGPVRTVVAFGGSISDVRGVEVWVNSENVHLEMSRALEQTVSATIRYLGAHRDAHNHLVRDTVAEELAALVGSRAPVLPATVVETSPGALAESHQVRRLLHVAAVQGELERGYRQVENVARCVTAALEHADRPGADGHRAASVALPLFGAGTGGGEVEATARAVIAAVLHYLDDHPGSALREVWVVAYTTLAYRSVLDTLDRSPGVRL